MELAGKVRRLEKVPNSTSALSTFQRAIATTGHNIANVNTEGFSRQRVDLTQRTPQFSGAGWIGSGTEVVTTERVFSDFLTREIRSGTTNFNQLETFYNYASQLDRLLADQDSGLQPALDGFFNSMQELADYPSSLAVRQTVLSEAEALVSRFNSLNQQLDERSRIQCQRDSHYGLRDCHVPESQHSHNWCIRNSLREGSIMSNSLTETR